MVTLGGGAMIERGGMGKIIQMEKTAAAFRKSLLEGIYGAALSCIHKK